ncbi:MAG: trypsin-like peptidase domain-containing protein [Anaerolineaceae bacterium]|nr:trypsin-like peptidase domain-containing protein [Anaerolineaceae bacterium]
MNGKRRSLLVFVSVFLMITTACQINYDFSTFGQDTAVPPKPVFKSDTPQPQLPSQDPPPPLTVPLDAQTMQDLLVTIYEYVNPGVVAIQTLTTTGGGLGSGFVIDAQGHIVTNYHVVDGANELEVDFPSGYKVRGEVIAVDLDSDLAVIQVNAPAAELHPLPLGNSDEVKVGQSVVAIGNPFGLSSTMTVGIVSAKGRTLESIREAPTGGFFSAGDLIQTDASINPGNSGGPLLNMKGEVIGINRAIRTTGTTIGGEPVNSGIGFAISINIVKRVVPVLIENGRYDYPYIGVTARESISLIEQEALGLSTAVGAYVVDVSRGSPADKAGLRGGTTRTTLPGLLAGGDLITQVDDQPVRVFGDLLSYLMKNKSPGDEITVVILRNGEQKEFTLKLEKRP